MSRENLQKLLCCYITDTLSYIGTARGFCEEIPEWVATRKKECEQINDKINVGQLTTVLTNTLEGLEKLDLFLDAVEKLAVTSQLVFRQNQAVNLSEETRVGVSNVINTARIICPLLLEFKRDAKAFFSPRIQNVIVLLYELNKHMKSTKKICDMLTRSCISDFNLDVNKETLVHLDESMSADVMQDMLCHINQLTDIRVDPHFRMVFLFQEELCSDFIREFRDRYPSMLQSLKELEENAVQLDRMNKGARISGVAGSAVGVFGSVFSIIGLFNPFTAGWSLGMIIVGAVLGITSGVDSIVTTATEIGVNHKHQNKASEIFQSFMEDVQCIQDCLQRACSHAFFKIKKNAIDDDVVAQVVEKGFNIVEDTFSLVNEFSDIKVLRKVPRGASNTANAATKGSLALSKGAKNTFIGLNFLFLGLDAYFIYKDANILTNGTETEVSKKIRARAELWRSEISSWEKIRDSLSEGLPKSKENKAILEKLFYPEM